MVCERCGKEKLDVRERLPYDQDVNGTEVLIIVCDECEGEIAADI